MFEFEFIIYCYRCIVILIGKCIVNFDAVNSFFAVSWGIVIVSVLSEMSLFGGWTSFTPHVLEWPRGDLDMKGIAFWRYLSHFRRSSIFFVSHNRDRWQMITDEHTPLTGVLGRHKTEAAAVLLTTKQNKIALEQFEIQTLSCAAFSNVNVSMTCLVRFHQVVNDRWNSFSCVASATFAST